MFARKREISLLRIRVCVCVHEHASMKLKVDRIFVLILGRHRQQKDRGVQVATGGDGERRGTSVLRVRSRLGVVESGQDVGQVRIDVSTVTSG